MKKTIIIILSFTISLFIVNTASHALTINLDLYPNTGVLGPFVDFYDYEDTEARFAKHPILFAQKNDKVIPTGLALANVLGYPNGQAMIGQFPHFEFGVSTGVAVYKLYRYRDFDEENPEMPGGGVNGTFHFGTGIDDRMDIMFKLFVFGFFYTYDRSFDQEGDEHSYDIEVTDNSILSLGVKTRFNLIRPSPRSLLSFGGVNINVAFDYMMARFSTKGTYFASKDVEFNIADPIFGDSQTEVRVDGTVEGSANVQWNFFSITPEVIAYANVLYFLNVYSGFAVSINRGSVTFEIDTRGTLYNREAIVDPNTSTTIVPADSPIATAILHSDSSMRPILILPRYILGLDFNFWAVRLQVEASSVLTSPTDSFTAQVGLSTGF